MSGITGCSGSVTTTTAITGLGAGIYKWNGTSWVLQGDGSTLPASPSSGDFYRLAEHTFIADATSGAGGDSDKVSIAGALGLNIVTNDTEATSGRARTSPPAPATST